MVCFAWERMRLDDVGDALEINAGVENHVLRFWEWNFIGKLRLRLAASLDITGGTI